MRIRYLKNMLLVVLSACFLIAGYLVLFYTFTVLPAAEIDTVYAKQSIIIEDRHGEFLFDFSEDEKRQFIPITGISDHIINATIAVEDEFFFTHRGVRLESFFRATWNNIKSASFSQGGSTITQQVIKNIFLTNEKKITRKIKEMFLAIKLEKQLSKEKILEIYLNTIPYGGVSYGIAEASNTFFGKKPDEVTIAEAAYLAALPNAPTFYSPYGSNRKSLEQRKNRILLLMLNQGKITREEYSQAQRENVHFRDRDTFSIKAPHFVFFVREMLEREYGPSLKALEGTKVKTTLDLAMHEAITELVQSFSLTLEERFGAKNSAALVLSAKTGEILSMVGSRDFFDRTIDGSVNILLSQRQPGSTFKPIVYAEAFEKGLRAETVLYDVQTQFSESCDKDYFESTLTGCYAPVNYTGRFSGPLTIREALAQSINIPAIKTLYLAGIPETIDLAKKMGISSIQYNANHYGLSFALGSTDITPLELAQAYNVFANDGIFVPYRWNKHVSRPAIRKRIMRETTARTITSILSDDNARAPIFGRNSALVVPNASVAAKTGTTNNSRDIWVVGYSPDVVVLVWAGNSDSTVLENRASGHALSPLFRDIMLVALQKYGVEHALFKEVDEVLSPTVPNIVQGIIDTEEPHSILHYITSDNITREPDDPTADSQYENWEFGVERWLNHHDIAKHQDLKINNQRFIINEPRKREMVILNEITTVSATVMTIPNTAYEFYINGHLIDSAATPTFRFLPSEFVQATDEEITLQVVATGDKGVYLAEQTYDLRSYGR